MFTNYKMSSKYATTEFVVLPMKDIGLPEYEDDQICHNPKIRQAKKGWLKSNYIRNVMVMRESEKKYVGYAEMWVIIRKIVQSSPLINYLYIFWKINR